MPYAALDHASLKVSAPSAAELRRIAADEAPASLLIVDYELESLEPMAPFRALETLKMMGASKLSTLAGVAALPKLKYLSIAPPPAWERTTRCIEIDSYQPLAACAGLERLTLLRVRPRDLDLAPIAALRGLRELHVAGVPEFTLEQHARLAAALPTTDGQCLRPYTSIAGVGFCGRCKGKTVLLTGAPPKAKQWLCPKCNEKKLAEHVQRWNDAKNAAI